MYEETNPPDIEESVVQAAVEKCFPHISNPRIQFFYHGTYNVYIVEEKYLFSPDVKEKPKELFFFKMILITPANAPPPYVVEHPPLTISILSISFIKKGKSVLK